MDSRVVVIHLAVFPSRHVGAQLRSQLLDSLNETGDEQLVTRGGDSYTVTATGGGDNQTSGGSLKMIADLDDWDLSLALNNPGQSGDPRSPHYRDLFELWSRGKYFPIFFSKPRIESVTEWHETFLQQTTATAQR